MRNIHNQKQFNFTIWLLCWCIYSNVSNVKQIKKNLQILQGQNELEGGQMLELTHYLNLTITQISKHQAVLYDLDTRLPVVNKTITSTMCVIANL